MSDKTFVRKAIPHLKSEYFEEQEQKILFNIIKAHIRKYKDLPNQQQLKIALSDKGDINEHVYASTMALIDELSEVEKSETQWVVDETEKWAQDRAMENAILKGVKIIHEKGDRISIPEMLRQALAVTFTNDVGLEFLDEKDINSRFKKYQEKMAKLPTLINAVDDITNSGFEKKSLNMFMGETNIGKTALMIAICANFLRQGFNGLYITLEMAEEKIMRRFDANALNTPINDIEDLEYTKFHEELIELKTKGHGRLVVKEFPAGFTTAEHIRNLIEELHIKKGFKPDFVAIDYLNLMRPITAMGGGGTYTPLKHIAEEVRGIMTMYEMCGLSATQINRDGYGKKNPGIDNISESMAVAHTVDYFCTVVSDEELEKNNQQIWITLKNRYSQLKKIKKLVNVKFDTHTITDDDDGSKKMNGLAVAGFQQQEEERRKKRKGSLKVENSVISDDISDLLDMIED